MCLPFFLFLSLSLFIPTLAKAQQTSNQNQPVITDDVSQKMIIKRLDLISFEAGLGNLAICQEDGYCLESAKSLKSWICAADTCSQKNSSKEAVSCFEALNDYSIQQRLQINSFICPALTTMNAKTRDDVLAQVPILTKDSFMESTAYLLALRESAASCENYIKEYVGTESALWTFNWYRVLAGCRILGKTSTRQQEERDFYTWFKVSSGSAKCSDISNSSMSQACSVSSALPL